VAESTLDSGRRSRRRNGDLLPRRPYSTPYLMQFAAARDVDRFAGNVFRATQIDHRLADIGRGLLALEERVARDKFVERRLAIQPVLNGDDRTEHVGPHRSAQIPGAYRVDANVDRAKLFRQRLGEA